MLSKFLPHLRGANDFSNGMDEIGLVPKGCPGTSVRMAWDVFVNIPDNLKALQNPP